ncbi:hypothetical protein CBM2626_A40013 [Cupriavidus taiwanensis]|nr:hypothetical protein CBM2626_A40013 [Cupriavidus taiwanensis]
MKFLVFTLPDIRLRRCIDFILVLAEPKKVRRISLRSVSLMLSAVIDDSRAMFAPPKHRMGPLSQLVISHHLIRNKEKLICTGNDANIDLSDTLKPMNGLIFCQFIEQGSCFDI